MLLAFEILTLILAAGFAVVNGARDAATTVSVAVRTRALTPTTATFLAALFNLIGALLSSNFAKVIDGGLFQLHHGVEGESILIAALLAALIWGIWQWRIGYPSSSTHALIGGFAGAVVTAVWKGYPPFTSLNDRLLNLLVLPLIFSPILAFAASYLLVYLFTWLSRFSQPNQQNKRFRTAQAVLTGAVAIAHGFQDGSRIVVVLSLSAIAAGFSGQPSLGVWLSVFAGVFLTVGTLIGGWRIAYTLSTRLVKFDPMRGMITQLVSSVMLILGGSGFGLPLATTQLTTSSMIGAGLNQRDSRFDGELTAKIALGWVATPIICAVLGGLFYLALSLLF